MSAEIVLIATILVLGLIAGLTTVRNAVVCELGDVACALANVNQSYSYCGVSSCGAFTAGSYDYDRYASNNLGCVVGGVSVCSSALQQGNYNHTP